MSDFLDYTSMQSLIEHQDWWFNPSEAHGILTALVAANQQSEWPALLFPNQTPEATATKTMQAIAAHIDTALANNDLRFQLMLPDDVRLTFRAEALTFWVQGFKLAITSLREQQKIKLDEDCLEFIGDLDAIAELDVQLSEDEENHRLLAELEEHCRMGALMIYAYTHTPSKAAPTQPQSK